MNKPKNIRLKTDIDLKDKILDIIAYGMAYIILIFQRVKRIAGALWKLDAKAIVKLIVSYASLLFVTTAVFCYIGFTCSAGIQLMAYVNGSPIGLIERPFTLAGSKEKLENDINRYTDEKYVFEYKLDYGFIMTNDKQYLTDNDCYYILNGLSEYETANVYSLYVDGVFIGANEEKAVIEELVYGKRDAVLKKMLEIDRDIDELRITNIIGIKNETRIKAALLSYEDIYSKLYEDESDAGTPKVEYVAVKYDIFTEVVERPTEYRDSDEYYTGVSAQVTAGADGVIELIYEKTYKNGKLLNRTLISEKTLVQTKPVIILVGTRPPPPKESTGKFLWPLKYKEGELPPITSYYAEKREEFDGDSFHYGIDIEANAGVCVYASDGGRVMFSGRTRSYGNNIKIGHINNKVTCYAHLTERYVEEGDMVYPGQIIGTVGMTGVATAPHLHFEIREIAYPLNPLLFLPEIKEKIYK